MMKLSINQLAEISAFTGAPVERTITWKQGDKSFDATVYVRPLGYRSAVADLTAVTNNTDPVAARIAACICDEDGKPIFTPADITGESDPNRGPLNGNLTIALLQVIAEVSALGKEPAS